MVGFSPSDNITSKSKLAWSGCLQFPSTLNSFVYVLHLGSYQCCFLRRLKIYSVEKRENEFKLNLVEIWCKWQRKETKKKDITLRADCHRFSLIASSSASRTAFGHKVLYFSELAFLSMPLTAASALRIRDNSLLGSARCLVEMRPELVFIVRSLGTFVEHVLGVAETEATWRK